MLTVTWDENTSHYHNYDCPMFCYRNCEAGRGWVEFSYLCALVALCHKRPKKEMQIFAPDYFRCSKLLFSPRGCCCCWLDGSWMAVVCGCGIIIFPKQNKMLSIGAGHVCMSINPLNPNTRDRSCRFPRFPHKAGGERGTSIL